MRKILIIGDANSIWIKKYIEYVLPSDVNEIYLTTTGKTKFDDFYNQRNVQLVSTKHRDSFIDKIPKVSVFKNILATAKALKKYGAFDVIHVHFVTKAALLLASLLKHHNTRIIASYWGSDLLRKNTQNLKKEAKFFSKISCFTISSDAMYEKFVKEYGPSLSKRINRVRFGVSGFDSIINVKETLSIEDCKKSIGANPRKILIAVGYNKASGQQHDKVLQQIATLDESVLNRIEIVLQCSYGECSKEYWENLMAIVSTLPCKTIIITDYMSDIDTAKLRYATDIYINAQITDAFCATMQEYLFAGTTVLNPAWLSYPEIKEFGLSCVEYKDISDIKEKLSNILTGDICRQTENSVIYNHTSWKKVKEDWEKCYSFPLR